MNLCDNGGRHAADISRPSRNYFKNIKDDKRKSLNGSNEKGVVPLWQSLKNSPEDNADQPQQSQVPDRLLEGFRSPARTVSVFLLKA